MKTDFQCVNPTWEKQKIQGTYFKICLTYFKISQTYFSASENPFENRGKNADKCGYSNFVPPGASVFCIE